MTHLHTNTPILCKGNRQVGSRERNEGQTPVVSFMGLVSVYSEKTVVLLMKKGPTPYRPLLFKLSKSLTVSQKVSSTL